MSKVGCSEKNNREILQALADGPLTMTASQYNDHAEKVLLMVDCLLVRVGGVQ